MLFGPPAPKIPAYSGVRSVRGATFDKKDCLQAIYRGEFPRLIYRCAKRNSGGLLTSIYCFYHDSQGFERVYPTRRWSLLGVLGLSGMRYAPSPRWMRIAVPEMFSPGPALPGSQTSLILHATVSRGVLSQLLRIFTVLDTRGPDVQALEKPPSARSQQPRIGETAFLCAELPFSPLQSVHVCKCWRINNPTREFHG